VQESWKKVNSRAHVLLVQNQMDTLGLVSLSGNDEVAGLAHLIFD